MTTTMSTGTTATTGEAIMTHGETFPAVLTHQDHHQVVEEVVVAEGAVEAVEEAALVQRTASRISYLTGLAYRPLKQS